jgi:hypothetical protein
MPWRAGLGGQGTGQLEVELNLRKGWCTCHLCCTLRHVIVCQVVFVSWT